MLNPILISLSLGVDVYVNLVRAVFQSEINLFNVENTRYHLGTVFYQCPNPLLPPPYHLSVIFISFFNFYLEIVYLFRTN